MSANIHDINENQPHYTVPGLKNVHVLPEAVFTQLANGSLRISDCDDVDDWLPTIIREWRDHKQFLAGNKNE